MNLFTQYNRNYVYSIEIDRFIHYAKCMTVIIFCEVWKHWMYSFILEYLIYLELGWELCFVLMLSFVISTYNSHYICFCTLHSKQVNNIENVFAFSVFFFLHFTCHTTYTKTVLSFVFKQQNNDAIESQRIKLKKKKTLFSNTMHCILHATSYGI